MSLETVWLRLRFLGMVDAFDPYLADFLGTDGKKDLFISGVIHKTFGAIGEAGTEATTTAVIFDTTSMPDPSFELTLDKPFIFLI